MRRSSPPIRFMSRLPVAWTSAPAPRNISPLKRAWFQMCSRAPAKASRATRRLPPGHGDQPQPQAEGDDTDVLDGRVGEAALEVVLQGGQGDAVEGAAGAEQGQQPAPPGRCRRQPGEDAQDAVEGGLHQDPRHQRRDVARGGGMGVGKPDVQGEQAGLDAEAEQCQQKEGGRDRGRQLGQGAEVGEVETAAAHPGLDEEGEQQHHPAMRDQQVEPGRPAYLVVVMVPGDEEEGGEGHQLPGGEKKDRVGRGDHQQHGGDQQVEKEPVGPQRPVLPFLFQVAGSVHGARRPQQGDGDHEPGRQGVEAQRQGAGRHRPGGLPGKRLAAAQDMQRRRRGQQPGADRRDRSEPGGEPGTAPGEKGRSAPGDEQQQGQAKRDHGVPDGLRPRAASTCCSAGKICSRPACSSRMRRKAGSLRTKPSRERRCR